MLKRSFAVLVLLSSFSCSDQGVVQDPVSDSAIDVKANEVAPQDLAEPDLAPVDISPEDAQPDDTCPGGFACPCAENNACNSGFCIETDNGNICTKTCDAECPDGYACIGVSMNTDISFICVPDKFEICAPCETKDDCAGTAAWCVEIPDGSKRCAPPCSNPDDCSLGFACAHIKEDEEGVALGHCIPTTGSCPCMETTEGETRSCEVTNDYGTCVGSETCSADEWSGCDAATPAEEVCDGVDNDCDGAVDEGFSDSDLDADGDKDCLDDDDDGDGDLDGEDCAPNDPAISKSATEICDGIDNNCDDTIDEGFPDEDGDGVADCLDLDDDQDGDPDVTDCAPDNPAISKNAVEICDGVDNNCDGAIDEGFVDTDGDLTADCLDLDDDGDGEPDETDCAPTDAAIFPQAEEVCDGIDNNCTLGIDEGFVDTDDDGLADCTDPDDDDDGDPDLTDCGPTDPAINAQAEEICDDIDNNCVGGVDETGCASLGEDCSEDVDCFSDFCVDGVCCESECGGTCLSCLSKNTKAIGDGICAPIVSGLDPENECEPNGVCDGQEGCFDFGAPIPVPAGTVVAWTGKAAEVPADWELCDGTGDTPDLSGRFIRGAGGDFAAGDLGPGGISGSTSVEGAHTGPNTASGGPNPNNQPYGYGRNSAGGHAHELGGPLGLPEHYTLAYIRATQATALPEGAVTWADGLVGANDYAVFEVAAGRFLMGVSDDTREAAGKVERDYIVKTQPQGGHHHSPGGHGGSGSTKASADVQGEHVHEDLATGTITDLPPYLVLHAMETTANTGAVLGVIVAYDGDLADLPPEWTVYKPLEGLIPLAVGGDKNLGDKGGTLDGPSLTGNTLPLTIKHSHNSADGTSGQVGSSGALHGDFDWVHSHSWSATVSPMVPYHTLHYIVR